MSPAHRTHRVKGTRPGRPRGRTSESTTRRDIVLAAREVFLEAGYEGATLQEIADRSGVNRSVLYHHFPTRRDVYDAAVADAGCVLHRVMARAAAGPTLVEQLTAYIRASQREECRDRHLFRFLIASMVHAARRPESPTGGGLNDAAQIFVERLVADAVRRGELDPATEVPATAATIASVLFGVGIHSGFIGSAAAMGHIRDQLVRTLTDGLPFADIPAPISAGRGAATRRDWKTQ
ncbi:TetR/AcrR family transcriptional regulator [Mycobacterium sp. PSTR-4-N]|uniref:TetR/AcrR family transcriptional regulator n=1 Tax=Mycobacterium sp. PSTR-4-N TaxID=2917745 RepID=UPI001F14D7C5|nr:TetR/AcrR family transcriptional regulator [Mycobacterium sp. PSTR-4-N]MCG7598036.1 TetR/AcrR family transcriptional regulator [Mycobacterium sp. PSTR-4-N]